MRKSWRVSFPTLHPGECGKVVEGFKAELAKMGYVSGGGSCFNGRLGREVLAYRKVNDMNRSQKAGAGLVKSVFAGKGGYHVKYPDAGEHAEVPLAKQVLVLIKDGKPFAIYPVSTGKPSTPTITGHYELLSARNRATTRRACTTPSTGTTATRSTATHEVPNYAASHGCVRTFIADQPRIYEQLHYGESIFVFVSGSDRSPPPPSETLLAELREHSLVIGEVTLASGATAQYYVDARRTLMRPGGFRAAGELIAARAHELGADAVGGPATAAIPPACAALAVPAGDDLVAFFVRGERKEHGLQRWVEGPVEPGVQLPRRRGHRDHRRLDREGDRADPRGGPRGRRRRRRRRPAGRRRASGSKPPPRRPTAALVTIDEIYPERPDRG